MPSFTSRLEAAVDAGIAEYGRRRRGREVAKAINSTNLPTVDHWFVLRTLSAVGAAATPFVQAHVALAQQGEACFEVKPGTTKPEAANLYAVGNNLKADEITIRSDGPNRFCVSSAKDNKPLINDSVPSGAAAGMLSNDVQQHVTEGGQKKPDHCPALANIVVDAFAKTIINGASEMIRPESLQFYEASTVTKNGQTINSQMVKGQAILKDGSVREFAIMVNDPNLAKGKPNTGTVIVKSNPGEPLNLRSDSSYTKATDPTTKDAIAKKVLKKHGYDTESYGKDCNDKNGPTNGQNFTTAPNPEQSKNAIPEGVVIPAVIVSTLGVIGTFFYTLRKRGVKENPSRSEIQPAT